MSEIFDGGYDLGERYFDARLARMFSLDPLIRNYPFWSPYQYSGNCPSGVIDLFGLGPGFPDEPPKTKRHVVSSGETLSQLAKNNKTTVEAIKQLNSKDINWATDPKRTGAQKDWIYSGEIIILPSSNTSEAKSELTVEDMEQFMPFRGTVYRTVISKHPPETGESPNAVDASEPKNMSGTVRQAVSEIGFDNSFFTLKATTYEQVTIGNKEGFLFSNGRMTYGLDGKVEMDLRSGMKLGPVDVTRSMLNPLNSSLGYDTESAEVRVGTYGNTTSLTQLRVGIVGSLGLKNGPKATVTEVKVGVGKNGMIIGLAAGLVFTGQPQAALRVLPALYD